MNSKNVYESKGKDVFFGIYVLVSIKVKKGALDHKRIEEKLCDGILFMEFFRLFFCLRGPLKALNVTQIFFVR